MTEITLIRQDKKIVGFRGWNHAEYGEHGSDILCAAISAILQQGAAGILEYLNIPATYSTNNETGFLRLDLKTPDEEKLKKLNMTIHSYNQIVYKKKREIKAILESMAVMLDQLRKQYPKYMKIFEEEAN
ncbi:ribosomal-processing cysteine protease Prp [Psychrilyobacter sp.]|uniref:ribosomal-processing cysteine protease Prp n=1 Tax=Psychrilyobacter sp. TaxID=2586924 RepID=UPI003019FD04